VSSSSSRGISLRYALISFIHLLYIHVYRFLYIICVYYIYIYICLAMRVMVVYFLTCGVVVVVFAFASPCTGAKYTPHPPPTTTNRHHTCATIVSCVLWGPYLRTPPRTPPPPSYEYRANTPRDKKRAFLGPSTTLHFRLCYG